MFDRLKRMIGDMRTISALCRGAERHANADGREEPGAEHFLLAALDLPDGTARRAFERAAADPSRLPDAIARQYDDALRHLGIAAPRLEPAALPPRRGIYRAAPSGDALMQLMAKQADMKMPLLGAHVLRAALDQEYGVVARALRRMEIDPVVLDAAACAEIEAAIAR